jgi:ribosomal protein L7Ae-like RNA K-turn-binding protein
MISLAMKAGRIKSGEDKCKKCITSGECYLAVIANDAGPNTVKSITNSCKYYGVKYVFFGDKANNGRAIGKQASAVMAVTDEGLAKCIEEKISANINGGE